MNLRERIEGERRVFNAGEIWKHREKLHRVLSHTYSSPNTKRGEVYLEQVLKDVCRNAVLLDYGCLSGWLSPKFRSYGARRIIGIDISEKGIAAARRVHGGLGEYYCMDAHELGLGSQTIDLIVGNGILHHLEYELALKEVYRVLRRGGYGVFHEPLRDNPFGKLIRRMTREMRTADELPLTRGQIEWGDRLFGDSRHCFINLASVPLGVISVLVFTAADNWIMRAADWLDVRVARTNWRYCMRSVVLVWRKVD